MGRPKNVISNSFVAYLTTIFNLVYLIGKSTFMPCQIYDLVGSPKSMGWVGFVVTLSMSWVLVNANKQLLSGKYIKRMPEMHIYHLSSQIVCSSYSIS